MIKVDSAALPKPSRATSILLLLLIVARLSLLVPSGIRPAAYDVYMPVTYILTVILVFLNRDNLRIYHLGMISVTALALAPGIEWAYFTVMSIPIPKNTPEAAAGIILLLSIAATRPKWPKMKPERLYWLLIAIGIGVFLGTFYGSVFRAIRANSSHLALGSISLLPSRFISQFSRAAAFEEPLFRGFLWGYLRQIGWREPAIWRFQAGLFWLGHFYYFGTIWFSFLVVVPVSALALGFVVWKSRSIFFSMITHGLINSVSDIVASLI